LGDGTTRKRSTPVHVTGLDGHTITSVAAGLHHSLAVASDGTVWAWGNNDYGQLGDGTNISRARGIQVAGLAGRTITSVSAGAYHSLAVDSDGTVWAWGDNRYGELGIGTMSGEAFPTQVTGLPGTPITSVSASAFHSVAVAADGTLWSWGDNRFGELGDGTSTTRTRATQVIGLAGHTVQSAAVDDYHSLAVTTDGALWAWGYNSHGQLGDGTTTNRSTPAHVVALADRSITSVDAAQSHSLAVASDGSVWGWGYNYDGQLGEGSLTARLTPTQATVIASRSITSIAAGSYHSLGIASDGALWAWGSNYSSQLGDGTTNDRATSAVESLAVPLTVTGVSLDDVPVTSFETRHGAVVFTTPPHPAGPVDAVVTTAWNNGSSAGAPTTTHPDAFTYTPDVPGSPTDLHATAGVDGVSLFWAAPEDDGGSRIISYKVQQYVGGDRQWQELAVVEGTTSQIAGLLSGTEYRFRVAAVNAVGDGVYSAPVVATTSPTPTVTPTSTATPTATPTAPSTPTSSPTPNRTVPVRELLQPARFRVSTDEVTVAKKKLRVKATGLAAREKYTVRYAGKKVGAGTASATGTVDTVITTTAAGGIRHVKVVGSTSERYGTATLRAFAARRLRVSVSPCPIVQSNRTLTIAVTRLAPKEPVTVRFRGKIVSGDGATANTAGVYTVKVTAGWSWGYQRVTAVGAIKQRAGSTVVDVERRRD
jgi:alpha-tubulin suppressor-like RCC1 family protein